MNTPHKECLCCADSSETVNQWNMRTYLLSVDDHRLELICLDCDQVFFDDDTGGASINLHDFLEESVKHRKTCTRGEPTA